MLEAAPVLLIISDLSLSMAFSLKISGWGAQLVCVFFSVWGARDLDYKT